MGANIGSTVTARLTEFKLTNSAFVLITRASLFVQ
jgi:Na+/phosphate symporter